MHDGSMRRLFAIACVLLPLVGSSVAAPVAAQDVRIWRCTDAKGKVILRDAPCRAGETTVEMRSMQRPKDAPPRAPAAAAAPPPAATAGTTRVLVLNPPQPMYECVDPDGRRYTSDSGDGNPRWVPYWTLGYPGYLYGAGHAGRGPAYRPANPVNAGIGRAAPPQPPPARGTHGYRRGGAFQGGGTWIADACQPLPQMEVCDRLRDRRSEIRTRRFNAQEHERTELGREERGINARLANDCGGA